MEQNEKFEGWAIVELFGHQKEIGFVTTRYFGGAAMFQIDIPELPEREVTMRRPGYVPGENGATEWAPAGTIVKKRAVQSRSRLVGPGAIYGINPCTEELAREVVDRESNIIALVSMPKKELAAGVAMANQLNEELEAEEV